MNNTVVSTLAIAAAAAADLAQSSFGLPWFIVYPVAATCMFVAGVSAHKALQAWKR